MKSVAQIGFALGIGLYMVAHLFGMLATRTLLESQARPDAASSLSLDEPSRSDPAFTVADAGEALGWAAPRQVRVITRTL